MMGRILFAEVIDATLADGSFSLPGRMRAEVASCLAGGVVPSASQSHAVQLAAFESWREDLNDDALGDEAPAQVVSDAVESALYDLAGELFEVAVG
jgi:hypothetical protein